MENVTAIASGDNLTTFLLVLVALAGLFILFANVVESARKLFKPKNTAQEKLDMQQNECDRKFSHDLRVLADHDRRIESLEEGSRVQCAALRALLEHELHNGNSAEMKKASDDLFDHLNRKN